MSDLPLPPGVARRDGPIALAGAAGGLAVLLLMVATTGGVMAAHHARGAHHARTDAAVALGAALPDDLVTHLQAERNDGAAHLVGPTGLLGPTAGSYPAATRATDTALGRFRRQVQAAGGAVADAFDPALARTADRLARLRATVDGFTGPPGLDQVTTAQPLFEGYSAVIDDLLAADSARRQATIGDAATRRGVKLHDLATRQERVSRELLRLLLLDVTVGDGRVDTADEVAAISAAAGEFETNDETIDQMATGAYRPLADALLAAPRHDQLAAMATTALGGRGIGTVGIGDLTRDSPYADFGHGVDRAIITRADERAARSTAAAWRDVAVAVVTALAAAGAAAVSVITVRRA